MVTDIPHVSVCSDPDDDFLLAMASAGAADFLLTGDKRHLLGLTLFGGSRIITVRDFLSLQRRLP